VINLPNPKDIADLAETYPALRDYLAHVGQLLEESRQLLLVASGKMDAADQALENERNRADRLGLNCKWLVEKFDCVHSALCSGENGTWQQRVEQVVVAAEAIYPAKLRLINAIMQRNTRMAKILMEQLGMTPEMLTKLDAYANSEAEKASNATLEEFLAEKVGKHICKYCGQLTDLPPDEQKPPVDYCHDDDHRQWDEGERGKAGPPDDS